MRKAERQRARDLVRLARRLLVGSGLSEGAAESFIRAAGENHTLECCESWAAGWAALEAQYTYLAGLPALTRSQNPLDFEEAARA